MSERDKIVKVLRDKKSECAKFLLDALGATGTRLANAVLGQRAFDGPRSTLTAFEAGINPSIGLFAEMTVAEFFAGDNPTKGAAAVYADGRYGSDPRDVYYSWGGLNATTILHETLHTFFGSLYPDDRSLATKLGVTDADYDQYGSLSIDMKLAEKDCK